VKLRVILKNLPKQDEKNSNSSVWSVRRILENKNKTNGGNVVDFNRRRIQRRIKNIMDIKTTNDDAIIEARDTRDNRWIKTFTEASKVIGGWLWHELGKPLFSDRNIVSQSKRARLQCCDVR